MLKKIHRHLLENHPLIWNMRLLDVSLVIVLFHLFHFFVDYSMFEGFDSMSWQSAEGMFFTTSFVLFSIIGSCIIFILWLIRVFRNNAFKSFYPFSNLQLFSQLLIILAVCLANITYYYSYTFGYVYHARHMTNIIANEEDIVVYNQVAGLLQSSQDDYALDKRCSPEPFPLTKKFKDNLPRTAKSPVENYYYQSESTGQTFSKYEVDSMVGGVEYSYLNFCKSYSLINPARGRLRMANQEYEFLKGKQEQMLRDPKLLRANMVAFLALCEKYNIRYRLDVDQWFKWVYNPPYFPAQYIIYRAYFSTGPSSADEASVTETAMQQSPKGYYVELQKLQNILQNTQRAYDYNFDLDVSCGLVYTALGIALMVFTFRATSRRVWLITLIGNGLIALILGAFTAVLAMNDAKEGILFFYIMVIASFFVIHLVSTHKTVSGVTLNWFVWSFPFLSVIIYALSSVGSYKTDPLTGRVIYVNSWVQQNSEVYYLLFVAAYLLILLFALVPRFRQWQAMPED